MQTRARRRARTAFVRVQVFCPPPHCCAFAAIEATSALFGSGAPSLVELAMRDALGAAGAAVVGGAVVLRADARGHGTAAGRAHSLVVKDGALFCSIGLMRLLDWATANQLQPNWWRWPTRS